MGLCSKHREQCHPRNLTIIHNGRRRGRGGRVNTVGDTFEKGFTSDNPWYLDSRKPFLICNVWPDFSSQQVSDEHSCQEQSSLSMKMDFKSNEGQRLLVFDLSFVVICDFPVAT